MAVMSSAAGIREAAVWEVLHEAEGIGHPEYNGCTQYSHQTPA